MDILNEKEKELSNLAFQKYIKLPACELKNKDRNIIRQDGYYKLNHFIINKCLKNDLEINPKEETDIRYIHDLYQNQKPN